MKILLSASPMISHSCYRLLIYDYDVETSEVWLKCDISTNTSTEGDVANKKVALSSMWWPKFKS